MPANDNLEKRSAEVFFELDDGIWYAYATPLGDDRFEPTFLAAVNAAALKDEARNRAWQMFVFDMVRQLIGVSPESVQVKIDEIGETVGRA
jgi:hypothetical protein